MSVGLGARDDLGAEVARGTGSRIDQHALAPFRLELLRDERDQETDRPARAERRHDPHWFGRKDGGLTLRQRRAYFGCLEGKDESYEVQSDGVGHQSRRLGCSCRHGDALPSFSSSPVEHVCKTHAICERDLLTAAPLRAAPGIRPSTSAGARRTNPRRRGAPDAAPARGRSRCRNASPLAQPGPTSAIAPARCR